MLAYAFRPLQNIVLVILENRNVLQSNIWDLKRIYLLNTFLIIHNHLLIRIIRKFTLNYKEIYNFINTIRFFKVQFFFKKLSKSFLYVVLSIVQIYSRCVTYQFILNLETDFFLINLILLI